ncbi:MAG: FMN-binding protein [Flavobacteriales bacterium]|nr:FMN-binding protein [Flavobacteriales bacterium]
MVAPFTGAPSIAGRDPDLGAEIATPMFQDQFAGKTITEENGTYTGIKVYKGGTGTTDPHGVDGISGGTITSDGVGEMLMRTWPFMMCS